MESLPRIVVTGASGFLGRHLLERLRSRYRVFALARRSQAEAGVPAHPNVSWHQVDIGHREPLAALFESLRAKGGARHFIHLAAYYDFTGEEDPEYHRSNVQGMRNVLALAPILGLRDFVFASSVAACPFPPQGARVNEGTPPDGDHVYSRTKRTGEEMLADRALPFKPVVARFAALYSDWCEYAPLYAFLDTWLSAQWNARILAGRGLSAVPYLHVHDAAAFLDAVLDRVEKLDRAEVLLASPHGSVSHGALFEAATRSLRGAPAKPLKIPRALCRPAMWSRDLLGRRLGKRPFERPWMARYIDRKLDVDASRTYERVRWRPRPRLEILARLPFLIENLRAAPADWHRRNRDAMKLPRDRTNLAAYERLSADRARIRAELEASAPRLRSGAHEPAWFERLTDALLESIRTRQKGLVMGSCRDLATRGYERDRNVEELCTDVGTLERICSPILRADPGLGPTATNEVAMTIRFAVDEVRETYDLLQSGSEARTTAALERQFWSGRGK